MSLESTVLEIGYWAAVWYGVVRLTALMLKMPPAIQKVEDKKKQRQQYQDYINNYISLFHALYLIVFCGYTILASPWQLNRSFTHIERMVVTVDAYDPEFLRLFCV